MRSFSLAGLIAAALLTWTPSASASPLTLDFTNTVNSNVFVCTADCTVGWSFEVNSQIQVDGLGIFDVGGNGLINDHAVGLWDSTGTLLASGTVTNAATPMTSISGDGRWMVQTIAPVILSSGTYTIGGFYGAFGADTFIARGTSATIPEIGFTGDALTFTAALSNPTGTDPSFNDGFFGATFTAQAVPEPANLMLLGTGILAVTRRVRRNREEK
jgi:hypothetical protein